MYVILFIIFGVWIYSLGKRVDTLQKEIDGLSPRKHVAEVSLVTSAPVDPVALGNTPPEVTTVHTPQVQTVSWGETAFEWLKKDFMVKLGAFLLLCAFGWFVSYAFANNWIGPVGRILLGLFTGAAFMVVGMWRIEKFRHQGGIFTVLGSTTILLTTYAARELYDMFTPNSALLIMFLSVIFVAFASVRYNRNALALAGLILASIAPLFTSAPAPDVVGLSVYLMIIVLGTLWVVFLRGWSNLTFTALAIVFLHGLPYLFSGINSGDRDIALLFSFLFTAIFFVANILGLIANENEENRQAHIAIAVGTGLYLILWITGAADTEWQSLLYAMWMLVFSVGSFIVYRVLESRAAFYIYGGTSVALLAAATAAELQGPVLTLAFTIEIALLVLLTAFMMRETRTASVLSWLFIGPILLSTESISSYAWYDRIVHEDFFVLVVLGIATAVVGRTLYELRPQNTESHTGGVLMVTAALYGLTLIWLVLHAALPLDTDTATMLSLIVYTLIGLPLYMIGKFQGRKTLKICGGALVGMVVLRLLTVEVWQMELTGRIITFLVIGSLLISTAFMRKQTQKEHLVANDNNA